jgi:hypothetical protein
METRQSPRSTLRSPGGTDRYDRRVLASKTSPKLDAQVVPLSRVTEACREPDEERGRDA